MNMAASMRSSNLGRHVFGAASLASGLITLAWHNYNDWDQLRYILNATDGPAFVYAVGALLIFGGTATSTASEYLTLRPVFNPANTKAAYLKSFGPK